MRWTPGSTPARPGAGPSPPKPLVNVRAQGKVGGCWGAGVRVLLRPYLGPPLGPSCRSGGAQELRGPRLRDVGPRPRKGRGGRVLPAKIHLPLGPRGSLGRGARGKGSTWGAAGRRAGVTSGLNPTSVAKVGVMIPANLQGAQETTKFPHSWGDPLRQPSRPRGPSFLPKTRGPAPPSKAVPAASPQTQGLLINAPPLPLSPTDHVPPRPLPRALPLPPQLLPLLLPSPSLSPGPGLQREEQRLGGHSPRALRPWVGRGP